MLYKDFISKIERFVEKSGADTDTLEVEVRHASDGEIHVVGEIEAQKIDNYKSFRVSLKSDEVKEVDKQMLAIVMSNKRDGITPMKGVI